MNDTLSRMVDDLFARSKEGKDLSTGINRLRDEIVKEIGSEESIFGRFTELLESFREIIPDERQRYSAAITALSATSKVSPQEVVAAANGRVEQLGTLEKDLMSVRPAWRNELKAMEARLKETRDELAKLRGRIARLEGEEKGLAGGMATLEQDVGRIEEAVRGIFADIGGEMESDRRLIGEVAAKPAPSQPTAQKAPAKKAPPAKEKPGSGQTAARGESPTPRSMSLQKACPMCGGQMNFHLAQQLWQCYTCAFEESDGEKTREAAAVKDEPAKPPSPLPASDLIPKRPAETPPAAPAASRPAKDTQASKKGPSPQRTQQMPQTKSCPVCRKQMSWDRGEQTWRCPYCKYSRSV